MSTLLCPESSQFFKKDPRRVRRDEVGCVTGGRIAVPVEDACISGFGACCGAAIPGATRDGIHGSRTKFPAGEI